MRRKLKKIKQENVRSWIPYLVYIEGNSDLIEEKEEGSLELIEGETLLELLKDDVFNDITQIFEWDTPESFTGKT